MTVVDENDQVATVGTEHTLVEDSPAEGKTYVLMVDKSEMVDGDTLELRVYTKIRVGDAYQVAYGPKTYDNAQAEPNAYSVPVPCDVTYKATLKQTAGAAGRTFPWKVVTL